MNEMRTQLDELISDARSHTEYRHELAVSSFTNQVAQHMAEQGITQAELARRMGVSRAWVSQLLKHRSSPTLLTVVQVATALGCDIDIALVSQPALRPSCAPA